MERRARLRTGILTALVLILVSILALQLFRMQIIEAGEQAASGSAASTYTFYTTVHAARGQILDCNGDVLVYNRTTYSLTLNNYVLFNSADPNGSLLQLAEMCDELGVEYTDNLPISKERPYTSLLEEQSSAWQGYFRTWAEERGWDPEISPQNLIRLMREAYHLPEEWTDEQARAVAGLRYELDLRYYTTLETYTLAEDIDSDKLARLLELGTPGLMVVTGSARCYNTTYCAHLLGRVGKITPDQVEKYEALGYPMDAIVGQDGIEAAFEEELHGTDGSLVTTVDESGNIIEQYYETLPVAGSNVELTIDLRLQAAAELGLAAAIDDLHENGINEEGEGKDAEGGAIVVMDVNTGRVLASASYPTFDLSRYSEDYKTLSTDPLSPLFNRALMAEYAPGSTFKMVTAAAALENGVVGRYYEIVDKGIYTFYDDFQPRCLLYKYGATHGTINMMQALSESCNYYFYEIGRLTGIDAIDEMARAFGLGEKTGIELGEEAGTLASPEEKEEQYEGFEKQWFGADTLQASIGQSMNAFTPLQMCAYISQLATGGTRYRATILQAVRSSDFKTVIRQSLPEVAAKVQLSEETLACIREGMEMCSTVGTARTYLQDYPISVASKTGTAQLAREGSDNAAFACFAPIDKPEIAIYIYVEKGAQGGNLANAAKAVMDVYFDPAASVETTSAEYTVQ